MSVLYGFIGNTGPPEQRGAEGGGGFVILVVGETIKATKIMRGTLQFLKWINFTQSLKRQEASNRLRKGTAPGNFGDRALCSNHWTVRGALLRSILDNWAVFQELWGDILEGKVDLKIRGQVIGVQTRKQSFNLFFTSCYKGQ